MKYIVLSEILFLKEKVSTVVICEILLYITI